MASISDDRVFAEIRDEYMAPIFQEIRRQAEAEAAGEEMRPVHIFRAFEDYFAAHGHRRKTLGAFLQDNVFLLSAIFLTLVFGAFGLYHPDDGDVASFLDIAKIFAGAVVGGAAGSSAVALTRRRAGRGGAAE